jgi:hypothetical protein
MASEKRKRKCKIEEISSKSNKMTDNPKKNQFLVCGGDWLSGQIKKVNKIVDFSHHRSVVLYMFAANVYSSVGGVVVNCDA